MNSKLSFGALAALLLMPPYAASQDEAAAADEPERPADEAARAADRPDPPLEQTVPVADAPEDLLDQSVPVADDEASQSPQLAETAAESAPVSEELLLEEFSRYRRLIGAGTLDEADIAAKRIVEMAIKVYGPRSRETASALNNLGIVQHSNGQFGAAIQNFTSAVEIIESAEDDRLNNALINPLKGLGAAQLSSGRPDQAQQTFTRAAHITHVNDGPHNLGQIEILESIAETHIRMGDTKTARDILDRIHIINVKYYEKDPLGLLPSLMNRASWQHRAGYYAEERASYRRAIRIIEATSGKEDPMLVEPLRRLGESFYFVDLTMATPQQQGLISSGEMYFKRAARIAQKSEDMDWRESTKSRIALGDYYTFIEAQNRSRSIYRETWDFLSTDEERIAYRDTLFSGPVPIREEPLPLVSGDANIGAADSDDIKTGKIVVSYSVSTRGRVKDIRTEAIPPEFTTLQKMVHREVRRRVFRPKIVDGAPVMAHNMVFEHEFSYTQEELDELQAAAGNSGKKEDKN